MKCVAGINKASNIGKDIGKVIGLDKELGIKITAVDNLEDTILKTKPNVIFYTVSTDTETNYKMLTSIVSLSNKETNPNGEYFNIIISDLSFWYPWRRTPLSIPNVLSLANELDTLSKKIKLVFLQAVSKICYNIQCYHHYCRLCHQMQVENQKVT